MQFILNEDEYKKLIHKDRIKAPVDDFIKELEKWARTSLSPHDFSPFRAQIQPIIDAVQTLKIKLDL